MGNKSLCERPIPNVVGVRRKCCVDPVQRLDEPALTQVVRQAALGHVLHEAMDMKKRSFGIAHHQRIGDDVVERLA